MCTSQDTTGTGKNVRSEEGFLSGEEERLLTELGVSPPEVFEADRPV